MGLKLELDFRAATDSRYEQLIFRQEGLHGFKLPGCWLPEFVKALEMPLDLGKICIYQDYWLENTRNGTTVHKSSIDAPLLSIDVGQRDKLIAHLKSAYAALL